MIVMNTSRLPNVERDAVTDLKMMLSDVQPEHSLLFAWENCLPDGQVLEGEEVALGNDRTLDRKRPPRTKVGDEVPAGILEHMPDVPFELDEQNLSFFLFFPPPFSSFPLFCLLFLLPFPPPFTSSLFLLLFFTQNHPHEHIQCNASTNATTISLGLPNWDRTRESHRVLPGV